MASAPRDRQPDPNAEALDAVREALPGPGDQDLVEHRPEGDPPQDLHQSLHNPLWGGDADAGP